MKRYRTLLVAGLTLALLLTGCSAQPTAAPSPSHSPAAFPTASVTPGAVPTAAASEPAAAPPAEPVLTVTMTGTVLWAAEWEPPALSGIYRVVDEAHGFPQDDGTRFYISHARSPWTAERSEGNDWVDTLTTPGGIVLLDGARYAVTEVITAAKTDIGAVGIWEHADGRAVLITCVPRWEGSAIENRIIILQKENA